MRIGVVGVGQWGRLHAQKCSQMEGVELVGVVDIEKGRSEEVASEVGCRPYYHHHDLLGKVEAVSIATPTPSHYAIAKDFLQEGVDVLLEKPMTTTLNEAKELESIAKKKGLILQIGHLERFNGAMEALDGLSLSPLYVDVCRMAPFCPRGTDVSVVLDLMIHDLDILLHLIPSPLREIRATGSTFFTPLGDVAHVQLEFENGCLANLLASRVAPQRVRRMIIHQRDSYLHIDFLEQRLWIVQGRRWEERGRPQDALEFELRSFLRSVRERRPPLVGAKEGRRALEVALKIIEEIERGWESRGDGS